MASIKLQNVTVGGSKTTKTCPVRNITFEVQEGEFFCIGGPSGSGKSTILRAIAGLSELDEGNIFIDNVPVDNLPPSSRDVAMIFETSVLYPDKTAFQNLAYPLEIKKVPKEQISKAVKQVAETLGVTHLLHRYPHTFSGGEQQRVAIGRAIIRRPKVYLLDEPLSSLDARIRLRMRKELKRLQRELNQTMIFVSHDQEEIMAVGDRIALVKDGEIQQIGTPLQLYLNPVNKFVAGYIGMPSRNFMDYIVKKHLEKFYLESFFRIDITELLNRRKRIDEFNKRVGEEVILGVSPYDVSLNDRKKTDESFKATVYMTEFLGSKTIVFLQRGDELLRVVVPAHLQLREGEQKWVEFNRDKILVFCKQTGARLC